MYLAVDIGGTKTLVASFSNEGEIQERLKFPTPRDYQEFLDELAKNVANLSTSNLEVAVVAIPGLLDRQKGIVFALGNLPWQNERILEDISNHLGGLRVIIENDARLGGLAEAALLKDSYQRVLYLTVSTGIGGALIQDGRIAKLLEDTEMGKMPLVFNGKVNHWEDFAGGRGVVSRFGKYASEITDHESWHEIGINLSMGIGAICSVLQPEVIVFGGGVGQFADKFTPTIATYLEKELHPVVRRPKALLAASHKEDGVIYGCYELVRQSLETLPQA
ncbi:MAG TPA: ROK family protein [Candidatus Limnocylindria bacterium]|nr:ROK family protein [Candidatus Limnocylindria bacterium]